MKTYKYVLYFFVALVTTLLDTSFFSFLSIFEASFVLTFSLLLVLTILDLRKEALYFGFVSILFYTIFSSLPVYLLFLIFLGIPMVIYLIKIRMAINLENFVWVIITLFFSNLSFYFLLIVFFGEVSAVSLTSFSFFIIINTILGLAVYYLSKILMKYFNIKSDDK